MSGPQSAEAAQVLNQQAARLGCPLRWVEPLPEPEAGGPQLGLRGAMQRLNAAVAVGAAEALAERGWPIHAAGIQQGLAHACWPGRLDQRLYAGRSLLVDGAHNPPAAAALRQELDQLDQQSGGAQPLRWLIGMQRHKDAPQLLGTLLRCGDEVRVVPLPAEHKSWTATELQEAMGLVLQQANGELEENLAWLMDSVALPVACGSLYLVAELLPLLEATN